MHIKRNQQGFTIIEVVLVLAIAGLIFLMIFIALPALQRGQRDTGRRNDVSTVASAVNTYRSNNKNSLLSMTSTNAQTYIDTLAQSEKSAIVVSTPASGSSATQDPETVRIYKNVKCGTVNGASITFAPGTTNRSAAVATGLENNGTTTIAYCQDA